MTSVSNVCARCEHPVTPEDGSRVVYAIDSISVRVYLHFECAAAWSLEFESLVPQVAGVASNIH
jgi:hypothetical protein